MDDLVLIGFGGHAISVIDSIEKSGKFRIAGYTDLNAKGEYKGYCCLGTDAILPHLFKCGIKYAFIAIGYMGTGELRDKLSEELENIGYKIPNIVDPTAVVSEDAIIEDGVFIGKGVIINSGSKIGKMSIINTGVIVEHESSVGAFSHIAVGTILCGNVTIDDHCLIGAGTTVIQKCRIKSYCIVGAGSVVLTDIEEKQTVVGIIKR